MDTLWIESREGRRELGGDWWMQRNDTAVKDGPGQV